MMFLLWKDEFEIIKKWDPLMKFRFDPCQKFAETYKSRSGRILLESVLSSTFEKTGKILAEMKGDPHFVGLFLGPVCQNSDARDLYKEIYEYHTITQVMLNFLAFFRSEKASN